MIVVDDALLLAILAEQQGVAEAFLITAAEAGEVFTTGSWFWRLARVVARPGQGALSVLWRQVLRTSSAGCITPWTSCPPKSAC